MENHLKNKIVNNQKNMMLIEDLTNLLSNLIIEKSNYEWDNSISSRFQTGC